LLLVPPRQNVGSRKAGRHLGEDDGFTARRDLLVVARSSVFWIIIVGMFLCMLATPLQSSQLNIMLQDNGLATRTAAWVVSIYAITTIVGRIACGLALDRFATPIVTTLFMIPPALGFFLLATPLDSVSVIAFSMMLVGVAIGAENDLISFLIARYFKLRIFSSTLSLLMGCVFLATATGSLTISAILKTSDSFSPFLYLVSGTVLVGSLIFLLLPKSREFEKVG
jgi:MFS family permease